MNKDNFGLEINLDLHFFTLIFHIKPLDWKLNSKIDLFPDDNMIYLWIGFIQIGLFW